MSSSNVPELADPRAGDRRKRPRSTPNDFHSMPQEGNAESSSSSSPSTEVEEEDVTVNYYGSLTKRAIFSNLPPRETWKSGGRRCGSDSCSYFYEEFAGCALTADVARDRLKSERDFALTKGNWSNQVPLESLEKMGQNAVKGCEMCQFFLGALENAKFTTDASQKPKNQSLLSDRWERVVELKFIFVRECRYDLTLEVRYIDPREKEIQEILHRAPFNQYPDRGYEVARCPLVLCKPFGQNHPISVDPLSETCISIVRNWLGVCSTHATCSQQKAVKLPTRVIEILDSMDNGTQLWTTAGATGQYVALSHCWGLPIMATTTESNLQAHHEGIILEDLPQSFRDAIKLTHRLGYRYLWIDSLCIVQDSEEDWAIECSKMAQTYANATMVIAAAAAPDSSCGFLKPRKILQSPAIPSGILREQVNSVKDSQGLPLFSRGWTYQEALLAPRILYYTENHMSWECGQGIQEEGFTAVVSPHSSVSKKYFFRTLEAVKEYDKLKGRKHLSVKSRMRRVNLVYNRLSAWCGCVEDYTIRHLTKGSDKLPALSGLASAIHDPWMGVYLAGIWSRDLATGLFWSRHLAREDTYNYPFTKSPTYRAPTWSWASYDGPINTRREQNPIGHMTLRSDICLDEDPPPENSGLPKDYSKQADWRDDIGARLVQHKILLATSDPYGQVLRGSHIILEGYTQIISICHQTASRTGQITINRDHSRGIRESFTLGPSKFHGKELLLFLLSRSKETREGNSFSPWMYNALILERVGGNEIWDEEHMERVGCYVIAESELYEPHKSGHDMKGQWTRREVKLF